MSYYFYITAKEGAEFDFFLSSKRYFCFDIPSSMMGQDVAIFFINQIRYILSIKSVYISKEGSILHILNTGYLLSLFACLNMRAFDNGSFLAICRR